MGKALVIKNANFSVNKIETVTFGDIHCTGIALDKSVLNFGDFNVDQTIVATLTPANTTDVLTWTSSNETVCTVENGVVTSHRSGTAKITAMCGEQTADCTVVVSVPIHYATNWTTGLQIVNGALRDFITGTANSSNSYIVFGSDNHQNSYPVSCAVEDGDFGTMYPYPIPNGATSVTVSLADFAPIFIFYDEKTPSTFQTEVKVRDSAKVLDGETAASGTDWSISGWEYTARTINLSDLQSGVNAFSVMMRARNATAFNNFDPANISVTFGYE